MCVRVYVRALERFMFPSNFNELRLFVIPLVVSNCPRTHAPTAEVEVDSLNNRISLVSTYVIVSASVQN